MEFAVCSQKTLSEGKKKTLPLLLPPLRSPPSSSLHWQRRKWFQLWRVPEFPVPQRHEPTTVAPAARIWRLQSRHRAKVDVLRSRGFGWVPSEVAEFLGYNRKRRRCGGDHGGRRQGRLGGRGRGGRRKGRVQMVWMVILWYTIYDQLHGAPFHMFYIHLTQLMSSWCWFFLISTRATPFKNKKLLLFVLFIA